MEKRALSSRLACAKETIDAFNEMEETLKRLRLRGDAAASASASNSFREGGVQNYVAAIRKAKEEGVKLRHEKEYRQFVAEEQKRENEAMSLYAKKEISLHEAIEQGLSLFEQETKSAYEAFLKDTQKSTDQLIRAAELSKKKALQDRLRQSKGHLSCSELLVLQQPEAGGMSSDADTRLRKKQAKAQATREYCRTIATGIAEVAMRVAEHTYTIGAVNEPPVICLPQDILLTTWNAWVNELVFPKTVPKPMSDVLALNSLRDLCDVNFKSNKIQKGDSILFKTASNLTCHESLVSDKKAASIGNQPSAQTTRAEHLVRRITDMQQNYGNDLIYSGVKDAIRLVKLYERNKYRFQLDNIRRQNDSESPEEVVPGWIHRLPPAGCFVYGDELSGLKAFTDMACSDSSLPTVGKRHNAHGFSLDTFKSLDSECSKWDVEPYHVLTPQMLLRTPLGGGAGQTGGGGAGGGGYSVSIQRGLNKGGGGTSQFNTLRGRESKQNEEVAESKQYIDALCDQLTKEIISVYQHNLQLLMRDGSSVVESKEAPPMSLRTLFLVGFPETGIFWRSLYQRLNIAVEIVEQETSKALMAEESGEELQGGQPPNNKAKSGRKTTRKTSAEESASSKKNKKPSAGLGSGKKGASKSSLLLNEEETPHPRARVYPPLCLCGIFLQYDVTSRYRRMREANRHTDFFSKESAAHKAAPAEEGNELFSERCSQRLRQELIQQDKKMRNSWKTWSTTVSKASVPAEPEAGMPVLQERLKKRSRVFVSRRVSEPTVVSTQSSINNQLGAFPKILFFRYKEDVTNSVKPADFLDFINTTLKTILNPSVWSVARNARLVPGQLMAPLKLSDYRFLPSVRLQMVELERRFQLRWSKTSKAWRNILTMLPGTSPPQLPQLSPTRSSFGSSPLFFLCTANSTHNEERKLLVENTVWLEVEMHRVFRIFFLDLFHFMNVTVFPPSLWSAAQRSSNYIEPNTNTAVETFSRTTHFFAVDENYGTSRESLSMLFDNGIFKLTFISAMLLRCVLDLALTSIGEALARLCHWACDHFCAIPVVSSVGENNTALPATAIDATTNNSGSTAPMPKEERSEEQESLVVEGNLSSSKETLISESVMKSFLATVPRFSFEELEAMVAQLDGRAESFKEFQQDLWSYGSRVHQTALSCLHKFIEDMGADVCIENTESFLAMAPHVSEVFVAYLFAFLPPDEMVSKASCSSETVNSNFVSEICSSVISVPIGRTVAAIRVLRRCCMVAGLCSARWLDSMYANALQIPPHSSFPAEFRPADIVDIFWPPDIPKQEGGASPPSLAFQLLARKIPPFALSTEEERNCWWETEMEVFLQNFSIYQKPVINKDEFLHCILQAELWRLWRFLPCKVHTIAERLGICLPFSLNSAKEECQEGITNTSLPYFSSKQSLWHNGPSLVTEEEALQLFWDAVQDQQKCLSNQLPFAETCRSDFLASFSLDAVVNGSVAKRSFLRLREFFISLILQRICTGDIAYNVPVWSHSEAVQEPSTMELRMMVKSLPRAVREQCFFDSSPGTEGVSIEDWKGIKWWQFFDNPRHARMAAFIQRYMLRLLTVCFGFVNGELCCKSMPLLSDVLFVVAATKDCRSMVERYFHAIAALGFLHKKREDKLQTLCIAEGVEAIHREASFVLADGPLMAFDLALTVDEVLFFFQRTGETGFCVSFPGGLGHKLSGHLCEPRSLYSVLLKEEDEEKEAEDPENNNNNNNNNGDDDVLSLATELTLLQEVENCSSITLTLLGASHWGAFITSRLTAILL